MNDPPFIIIPLGFDIITIPLSVFTAPENVDIPLRTLFNTALVPFKKLRLCPLPTFKCPQLITASPLKFKFAELSVGLSKPVNPPWEPVILAPP